MENGHTLTKPTLDLITERNGAWERLRTKHSIPLVNNLGGEFPFAYDHDDHRDHGAGGHHDHTHPRTNEAEPNVQHQHTVTKGWRNSVVAGNAALGLMEIWAGGASTLSLTMDGLHNGADAGTYYLQGNDAINHHSIVADQDKERRYQQRRKAVHWIIALSSIVGSTKAGLDLHNGAEHESNLMNLGLATASVSLNGFLWHRLRQSYKNSEQKSTQAVRDLVKHFAFVDMPSALLAFVGTLTQNIDSKTEQVAAIASGVVAASAFRPTKKNMAHNCLNHDYGHHSESDGHSPTHHNHDHEHGHGHTEHHHNHEALQHSEDSVSTGFFARFRKTRDSLRTKTRDAALKPAVIASDLVAMGIESIRLKPRYVALVGAAGLGAYILYNKYGIDDPTSNLKDVATAVKSPSSPTSNTAQTAMDSLPTIGLDRVGLEHMQSIVDSAADAGTQVAETKTAVLGTYNSATGRGTVWGVAESFIESLGYVDPNDAQVDAITDEVLKLNELTGLSARTLQPDSVINLMPSEQARSLVELYA